MNNKILFMILDNEVKYLTNSPMDHKEWYESLNLDMEEFNRVIRGFILGNKIIFYKSDFRYDDETIKVAEEKYPEIRKALKNPNLEAYCGVYPGKEGEAWEPIVRIDNPNIDNRFNDTKIERQQVENSHGQLKEEFDPLIEFQNDYENPKVIRNAIIVTVIVLIINFILKFILHQSITTETNSRFASLLVFLQFILLIASIVCYKTKVKQANIVALAASIAMFLTFNIFDIILGLIYFMFTIDQSILFRKRNKKVNK